MSLAQRMAERGFDSDDDSESGLVREKQRSRTCGSVCSGILLQIAVYLKLNGKDISARKGTYCLGVASCFVVVLITALMLTVMGRLPVVFMRLAELEEGEADLIVSPGSQAARAQSLNYSRVLEQGSFRPDEPASYHTPRRPFAADASGSVARNLNRCRNAAGQAFDPADPTSFYPLWTRNPNSTTVVTAAPSQPGILVPTNCSAKLGCPEQYCDERSAFTISVIMVDIGREERMGLGRDWPLTVPLRQGGAYIHQDLASSLNVAVGDFILVQVDVSYGLLQAFIEAELDDWLEPPYTTFGRVLMPIRIDGIASENGGKFGTDFTDYVLLDFNAALRTMAPFLNPVISARKRQLFADAPVDECAGEVIFNFPPDERTDMYAQRDAANVLADATMFATPIIATLGFNQVDVSMPIVRNIRANRFFALFLGLILSLLIMGLGFLCIVLIHSLLTVGVETRTFELGIMRMVGMTRTMLSGYVLTGALLFAIPAWALGLAVAQLVFLYVQQTLENSLGVEVSPMLTADAIGFATLVGIGMPLVSSIAPIVQVLALDLPAALDTNRSRTQAITYDIRRGGEYHVDWRSFGIGLAMAIAGFLIYYLFPLALITFNITLLFYIFFGILMGMLFGLVLLTTSLEGVVELGVMYVFLWWENDGVFQMIRKNLIAHRLRNRKTTLMFAMSIGFLIFLSVTFNIQIQSVLYAEERGLGGSLTVQPKGQNEDEAGNEGAVPYTIIEACEKKLVELQTSGRAPGVRWAWLSAGATNQKFILNASSETVGRYKSTDAFTAAVSPNFFEITNNRYLIEKEVRDTHWELAESLYSLDGSSRAIVSSFFQDSFNLVDFDAAFVLRLRVAQGNNTPTIHSLARTAAWLDTAPVISFSKYTIVGTSVIVSLPSLHERSDESMMGIENFGVLRFVIDVPGGEAETKFVKGELQDAILEAGGAALIEVADIYTTRDSLQVAVQVITVFFVFAQVMATFICYFALSSSMSTNIHEQSKEIGVLRCIGFRKSPMTRTYVWEAFVLVFASSLLGILVGVIMGYTIVLQRALFTQLPLPFVFPWVQLLLVFGLSLILAAASSLIPIRTLLATRSQASIVRRAL